MAKRPQQRSTTPKFATLSLLVACSIALTSCDKASNPTHSTSRAAMPDDTVVCDLATASQIFAATKRKPSSFHSNHKHTETTTKLHCYISFSGSTPSTPMVEIMYDYHTASAIGVPGDGSRSFDSVAALKSASPLSVDGLEGRGVVITDALGKSAVAWEYRDGHVLSMTMSNQGGNEERLKTQNTRILISLLGEIGNKVPSVATGPDDTSSFP